jgi:thiosulfate/3-mercaptopyruvate sulfurtransferase
MRTRLLFCASIVLLQIAGSLLAQETRPNMLITSEALARNGRAAVILDVGDPTSFAQGHIPRARLLESSSLVVDRDGTPNELPPVASLEALFTRLGIGDRQRIILYSRDPILATRAWFTLDYLGQGRRTAILDGGYAKWVAEERPIETNASSFGAAAFHARPNPQSVASLALVRKLVGLSEVLAPRLAVIDARSPEQYCGEIAGAQVARAGRIPGAVNVPWNENLTADQSRFLPERELREIYESAGVTKETSNIVYCRSGMQASLTYFVLTYLGYNAVLYDGSFVEWSNAPDTIVVQAAAAVGEIDGR